jgi:hypothetical protein
MDFLRDDDAHLAGSREGIALDTVDDEGESLPLPRTFDARVGPVPLSIDVLKQSLELG